MQHATCMKCNVTCITLRACNMHEALNQTCVLLKYACFMRITWHVLHVTCMLHAVLFNQGQQEYLGYIYGASICTYNAPGILDLETPLQTQEIPAHPPETLSWTLYYSHCGCIQHTVKLVNLGLALLSPIMLKIALAVIDKFYQNATEGWLDYGAPIQAKG